MSESETLQKVNRDNPSRNISTSDHAMMAWDYLEEPINEMKMEQKMIIHLKMKKLSERI